MAKAKSITLKDKTISSTNNKKRTNIIKTRRENLRQKERMEVEEEL